MALAKKHKIGIWKKKQLINISYIEYSLFHIIRSWENVTEYENALSSEYSAHMKHDNEYRVERSSITE